jgi:cellulose synthase/poly-beta-1,6-N-acetylglucosamine synthase-like glycosyltransferase
MTHPNLIQVFFWFCFALLFYTFAGYPVFIFLLSQFSRRSVAKQKNMPPTVTLVLTAYNEEARIGARIQNLLSSNYAEEKLDLVIVSDGSSDETIKKIQGANETRIQLIEQKQRSGKAQCLNIALALARGEIIVFADTRQRFASDTISELVKHFSDPRVGAVSGALMIETAATSVGEGVDAYWRLEKFIRESESKFDSAIGCTGAVYAIRRELFQQVPADTLLDDVVIPMKIALAGYRVLFEPKAVAFDPQSLEPERELIRKRRTLAGNYQMLFRYPGWLLPWRNRLWWQLISHKYLRLAGPFLMVMLLLANAALVSNPLYRLLFLAQLSFYALALVGSVLSKTKIILFSIPSAFVFLNLTALRGLWHYIQLPSQPGWQTTRPNKTASHV